jgi:hypothetical protein
MLCIGSLLWFGPIEVGLHARNPSEYSRALLGRMCQLGAVVDAEVVVGLFPAQMVLAQQLGDVLARPDARLATLILSSIFFLPYPAGCRPHFKLASQGDPRCLGGSSRPRACIRCRSATQVATSIMLV